MSFFIGFIGALVFCAVFAGGFYVGYKVAGIEDRRKSVPEIDETQEVLELRRKLRAEQAAFSAVQNYTAEQAYGVQPAEIPLTEHK